MNVRIQISDVKGWKHYFKNLLSEGSYTIENVRETYEYYSKSKSYLKNEKVCAEICESMQQALKEILQEYDQDLEKE